MVLRPRLAYGYPVKPYPRRVAPLSYLKCTYISILIGCCIPAYIFLMSTFHSLIQLLVVPKCFSPPPPPTTFNINVDYFLASESTRNFIFVKLNVYVFEYFRLVTNEQTVYENKWVVIQQIR